MSSLRPANHSLVQQRVLLRGVGACGLYNCKIAKKKKRTSPHEMDEDSKFESGAFRVPSFSTTFFGLEMDDKGGGGRSTENLGP